LGDNYVYMKVSSQIGVRPGALRRDPSL
jgi:hypothetical protein